MALLVSWPLAARTNFNAQPFRIQRLPANRLSHPTVPVGCVALIALFAKQVGVNSRTLGAFVPLGGFVRPRPIALGVPPQSGEGGPKSRFRYVYSEPLYLECLYSSTPDFSVTSLKPLQSPTSCVLTTSKAGCYFWEVVTMFSTCVPMWALIACFVGFGGGAFLLYAIMNRERSFLLTEIKRLQGREGQIRKEGYDTGWGEALASIKVLTKNIHRVLDDSFFKKVTETSNLFVVVAGGEFKA